MKYLMSRHILEEDAERVMLTYKDDYFVSEYQLNASIQEAVMAVCSLYRATGGRIDKEALWASVAPGIIADIDAIVCYPEDSEGYGCFGKKIITVEHPKGDTNDHNH